MEHQETIKQAARRMCEHFDANGVKVKHSLMLEALAKGLGLDNWRTLKAVIDAPRAPAAPAKKALPLGEWQQWTVHGIYTDNDQQYGDYFSGRTPLEGAINAMMDRLTDCGLEIYISEVLDADKECQLSPSFITEIVLLDNVTALTRLLKALPADLDASLVQSREWLQTVLKAQPQGDRMTELTGYFELEEASAETATICEDCALLPTQALELLCEAVESAAGGVVALEKANEKLATACYQVRAMCSYFETLLNSAECSPLLGYEAA